MQNKTDKREKNLKKTEAEAEVNATPEMQEAAACDDTVSMTKAEFMQVKEHIDALTKERDELISLAKRTQADFDNFRKRNATIYCDSLDEGVRSLTKDMLPVIDNFDRALLNCDEGEAWREGVKLVYKQLMGVLEKNGLEELDASGMFDAELHDAVLQEEKEGKAEGEIIEVLQKGYKVKNRIIRHSMVKVAK